MVPDEVMSRLAASELRAILVGMTVAVAAAADGSSAMRLRLRLGVIMMLLMMIIVMQSEVKGCLVFMSSKYPVL